MTCASLNQGSRNDESSSSCVTSGSRYLVFKSSLMHSQSYLCHLLHVPLYCKCGGITAEMVTYCSPDKPFVIAFKGFNAVATFHNLAMMVLDAIIT